MSGILKKLFKPRRYDMDTIEGINAIPVPAKDYNTGNGLQDCIYYILQRKATEHKKNGNMELAIACLRKSNELSDYEKKPLLLEKDYFRLVKYLKLNKQDELADIEEAKIYKRHPEFADKRISNFAMVKETLQKCREYKNDFVYVTTNSYCPICSQYNRKIYSISGRSKKYEKLPDDIRKYGGSCKECRMGISIHFEIKK